MRICNGPKFWCAIIFFVAAIVTVQGGTRIKRILVVGDSWAMGMTHAVVGRIFQTTLDKNGYKDIEVAATDETTRGGWTAAFWASDHQGSFSSVKKVLESNPSIDIVFITTGGADFLTAATQTNLAKLSEAERKKIWKEIVKNTQTLVESLLAVRPDIKVVLCDYDFLNIEKSASSILKLKFNDIPQEDFNRAFVELGREKRDLAKNIKRCFYVQNWGVLQHHFGDKTLPLPGGPPKFSPYPGGDITKPGPAAAFDNVIVNDGIHPNARGYRLIIENALTQVLKDLLKTNATETKLAK